MDTIQLRKEYEDNIQLKHVTQTDIQKIIALAGTTGTLKALVSYFTDETQAQ